MHHFRMVPGSVGNHQLLMGSILRRFIVYISIRLRFILDVIPSDKRVEKLGHYCLSLILTVAEMTCGAIVHFGAISFAFLSYSVLGRMVAPFTLLR